MKRPIVFIAFGMLLAFAIMAGVVGFANLVFADRGVVVVNNSDIDVPLSELENEPSRPTATPRPHSVTVVNRPGDGLTSTPGADTTADARRTPIAPARATTLPSSQPLEDGGSGDTQADTQGDATTGTDRQGPEHELDRRDESYRAQLLQAYDRVATVRPRVRRPVRRTPTPESLIVPAPTQPETQPTVAATVTPGAEPDHHDQPATPAPQPPAKPGQPGQPAQPTAPAAPTSPPAQSTPRPVQPTPQPAQPTQPPAQPTPKPTEAHDDDHKPEPTEVPEVHPTEKPEPTETHH